MIHKEECYDCEGSGENEEGDECYYCHGSGVICGECGSSWLGCACEEDEDE